MKKKLNTERTMFNPPNIPTTVIEGASEVLL